MAQHGGPLQNYNNELVKCTSSAAQSCLQTAPSFIHSGIEDLKEKREEVNRQILKEEEEKAKIQNDLRILTERLSKINDSLARKAASRNEYDKTIMETEAAYMKVGAWLCLVRVPPVGLRRRRNTSDEGRDGAAGVSQL
jgi:Sjoegren syndrome nuclear autoantigen 1